MGEHRRTVKGLGGVGMSKAAPNIPCPWCSDQEQDEPNTHARIYQVAGDKYRYRCPTCHTVFKLEVE